VAYSLLADIVLVLHLAFILFVVLGGLLVLRYPLLAIAHIPAALWGAVIELTGGVCPLTPLEKRLRDLAGEKGYEGDFIEHYLMPVIYPHGLTRDTQFILAAVVIGINLAVYGWLIYRRKRS
jgi:hypothetical protein